MRRLHRKAKDYLGSTIGKVKFISHQAQAFILEIDSIDPSGECFRYSRTVNDEELRPPMPTRSQAVDGRHASCGKGTAGLPE